MVKRKTIVKNNPLVDFVNNATIKINKYEFNNHKQWDELGDCLPIFEAWYNHYNDNYKHIKHAFNSLCKYYELIRFNKNDIQIHNKTITTFWTMQSFFSKNSSKTWIFQYIENEYMLVAYKDDLNKMHIYDDDLDVFDDLMRKL